MGRFSTRGDQTRGYRGILCIILSKVVSADSVHTSDTISFNRPSLWYYITSLQLPEFSLFFPRKKLLVRIISHEKEKYWNPLVHVVMFRCYVLKWHLKLMFLSHSQKNVTILLWKLWFFWSILKLNSGLPKIYFKVYFDKA